MRTQLKRQGVRELPEECPPGAREIYRVLEINLFKAWLIGPHIAKECGISEAEAEAAIAWLIENGFALESVWGPGAKGIYVNPHQQRQG